MRRERKNNRLDYYDYSWPGWYFVTFCTQGKVNWFGRIVNGRMELNERGRMADLTWRNIPDHYENIGIDEFVIMPNHVHGIVVVKDNVGIDGMVHVGTAQCAVPTTSHPIVPTTTNPVPTPDPMPKFSKYGLLPRVIKAYKEFVGRRIRAKFPDINFSWQRSFYDHIIRNEQDYWRIVKYIRSNPEAWPRDDNNPDARKSQNLIDRRRHGRARAAAFGRGQ